jgi:hypothetical protein
MGRQEPALALRLLVRLPTTLTAQHRCPKLNPQHHHVAASRALIARHPRPRGRPSRLGVDGHDTARM